METLSSISSAKETWEPVLCLLIKMCMEYTDLKEHSLERKESASEADCQKHSELKINGTFLIYIS